MGFKKTGPITSSFYISLLVILLIAAFPLIAVAQQQNETLKKGISIAKLNGYEIVYDCYGCRKTSSDSAVIYARKYTRSIKLLTVEFDGNYIIDIAVKYFLNHPFLYITSGHTHGHFNGELYALDMVNINATGVLEHDGKIKIPADLTFRNNNGIVISEKGELTHEMYYKGNDAINYTYRCSYKMTHVKGNQYALQPVKTTFTKDGY